MRILELFSGIGAVAHAAGDLHDIACAIDISELAMQVYRANFRSPTRIQEITSLTHRQLADFDADLWWMSPPCQPFTRRGLQRDLDDSRTKPLLRMIDAIKSVSPPHIAMENVIGFERSETFQLLIDVLRRNDYQISHRKLCSTQFGLPNLRPRFFLAASRMFQPDLMHSGLAADDPITDARQVGEFLDDGQQLANIRETLYVGNEQIAGYRHAVNTVKADSQLTRCFTSAYGRSIVRSGSYLEFENGFRRFSPREAAKLLGFSTEFKLPETLTARQLWKLLGNTVSVPCARHALNSFRKWKFD